MGEAVGELEARGAGSKGAPKAARIDAGALDVGQVQGLLGNTIKLSDLLVVKARDASRFAESDKPALCEEDEEPDDPAVTEAEQDLDVGEGVVGEEQSTRRPPKSLQLLSSLRPPSSSSAGSSRPWVLIASLRPGLRALQLAPQAGSLDKGYLDFKRKKTKG